MKSKYFSPFQWTIGVTIAFIAVAQCGPIEVIYTDDECDCPREIGYHVNYPHIPKPRKCPLHNYGYTIEKPKLPPPEAHVTYTFDFTVEEPKPPKPPRYEHLPNLFAKIDRITAKKPKDCIPPQHKKPYKPPAKPHKPASCSCKDCGSTPYDYRYVFQPIHKPKRAINAKKNQKPICQCQRVDCPFKKQQTLLQNQQTQHVFIPFFGRIIRTSNGVFEPYPNEEVLKSLSTSRKRRDLRSFLMNTFNPKHVPRKEYTQPDKRSKFVKKYSKNLSERPKNFWEFKFPKVDHKFGDDVTYEKTKSKSHKGFLKRNRSQKVKRDIKGEYDILEKERQEMDLTLPDIIQYLPETLHPEFKSRRCYHRFDSEKKPTESTPKEGDGEQNKIRRAENEEIYEYTEEESVEEENQIETGKENIPENDEPKSGEQNENQYSYHPMENINELSEAERKGINDFETSNSIKESLSENPVASSSDSSTSTFQKRDANNYDPNSKPNTYYKENEYEQHPVYPPYRGNPNAQPQSSYYPNILPSFSSKNLCPFYPGNSHAAFDPFPTNPIYPFYQTDSPYSDPGMPSYRPFLENFYQPNLQEDYSSNPRAYLEPSSSYAPSPSDRPLNYDHPTESDPQYYEIPDAFMNQERVLNEFKYLPNYNEIEKYLNGLSIADPLSDDRIPLHFTGDLESSSHYGYDMGDPYLSRAMQQPVQHLSNEELDRIISDIIYRHPDFIESGAHPNGALVDPEPQQKHQTVGFLKKLIGGRLHKLFSNSREEDEISYLNNDYRAEFDPRTALDAYYTELGPRQSAYESGKSPGVEAKTYSQASAKESS